MLSSTLLPLLSLLPLTSASRTPKTLPHKLVSRQDSSVVPSGCIPFYTLVDSCTSALSDEQLEGLVDQEEPPADSCFCSQLFFDSASSCASALPDPTSSSQSIDPVMFLEQMNQFRSTCLSSGFALSPSSPSTGLIPIPTVTTFLDDGIDDASSTSSGDPVYSIQTQMPSGTGAGTTDWNTIVTRTTSEASLAGGSSTRLSASSSRVSGSGSGSESASASATGGGGGSTGGGGRKVGGAGGAGLALVGLVSLLVL